MKFFILALSLATLIAGFQNCSKTNFVIDETLKAQALKDTSVFTGGSDPTTGVTNDGGIDAITPNQAGTPNQVGVPLQGAAPSEFSGIDPAITSCPVGQTLISGKCRTIDPNGVTFTGTYQCFSKISGNKENGGVVATASEVIMVVAAGSVDSYYNGPAQIIYQTKVAANGKSLKQDILDNDGFTNVAVPPGSSNGVYTVVFYDPSYNLGSQSKFYQDPATWQYYVSRKVFRGSDYLQGEIRLQAGRLVDKAGSPINPAYSNSTFVLNWAESNDPRCDGHLSSPLIVDMRNKITKKTQGVSLTSQLTGILFDIMGLNASPKAYDKKQISWLENPDKFMFLSLPNAQGQVTGINELFGDNTQGPDGKFPANGYQALAKYDLNKDGLIDERDAIFSKLRLWSDLNRNGSSESNELQSLEDAGIVAIDLKYDESFVETDQYGNKTTMKSVVKFKNGELKLIFDLWFKHEM